MLASGVRSTHGNCALESASALRKKRHAGSTSTSASDIARGGTMPSCRCLILTAATAIVGCSSPSSDTRADASTDRAAIVTAMNAYLTAVKSSDASAIASRWTDDAFYIDRKSPTLRGSAGIDSMLKAALAQVSIVDARLEADDIAVSGDIGYYLGHID